MKKEVSINGKNYTIKTRTPYAPKERAVSIKKQYKRSKEKINIKTYIEEEK
jgi:hypothetical protein